MSLRWFSVLTGLYTEKQTQQEIYTTAIYRAPDDNDVAWWPAIARDQYVTATPSSRIRDPLYRYMHSLIASSIAGRFYGTGIVSHIDLFYLRCLLTHRHVHLGRGLVDYFVGYYHRKERSKLVGRHIVARIDRRLNYGHAMSQITMPSLPPRLADRHVCTGMRIAKKFDGHIAW